MGKTGVGRWVSHVWASLTNYMHPYNRIKRSYDTEDATQGWLRRGMRSIHSEEEIVHIKR